MQIFAHFKLPTSSALLQKMLAVAFPRPSRAYALSTMSLALTPDIFCYEQTLTSSIDYRPSAQATAHQKNVLPTEKPDMLHYSFYTSKLRRGLYFLYLRSLEAQCFMFSSFRFLSLHILTTTLPIRQIQCWSAIRSRQFLQSAGKKYKRQEGNGTSQSSVHRLSQTLKQEFPQASGTVTLFSWF